MGDKTFGVVVSILVLGIAIGAQFAQRAPAMWEWALVVVIAAVSCFRAAKEER